MTSALFTRIGFVWDRAVFPAELPVYGAERIIFWFQCMMQKFVWDAGVLEGILPQSQWKIRIYRKTL